jgi:hypothetical protein
MACPTIEQAGAGIPEPSAGTAAANALSSDRVKTPKQGSADFVFFEVCGFLSGRTAEFQQIETLRYLHSFWQERRACLKLP